jgi:hypothetical protein
MIEHSVQRNLKDVQTSLVTQGPDMKSKDLAVAQESWN